MVQMLTKGRLSVEEAWKSKQLSVEQASYILEKEVGFAGNFAANGRNTSGVIQPEPVRRALAALLVQHDARLAKLTAPDSPEYSQREKEQKERLQQVPLRVRMWVGEYLSAQKDVRAETVLQSVLDEVKAPLIDERQVEVLVTSELLSAIYRGNGNYERSAVMWLKADAVVARPEWKIAVFVEAGRDYRHIGNVQKALELCTQATQFSGVGYPLGIALFDKAQLLMIQGKYEEAREILRQPVLGPNADEVRASLLSLLGYSFYATRDFKEARKYSQEAVSAYVALKGTINDLSAAGARMQLQQAQETLQWIEQWEKAPVISSIDQLDVVVTEKKKPVTRSFFVRSSRPVPVTITSDNPNITVVARSADFLLGSNQFYRYFHEKEVSVKIASEALNSSFDATLTVRSPELPDFQTRIPVHVVVQTNE